MQLPSSTSTWPTGFSLGRSVKWAFLSEIGEHSEIMTQYVIESLGNLSSSPQLVPRVSLVLCAFNEVRSVPHVIGRIPGWVDEVILVDAGSADGTVEAAMALRPSIRVLRQMGRGKDKAVRLGVLSATGEIVVTMDCDGETDPRDLIRFIEPLLNSCDFVKGSRFAAGLSGKPAVRRLGNWIIMTVFNLLYGTKFTDLCSGYNAFWRERALDAGLWMDAGWYYEPRIVAQVMHRGLRVGEVAQTFYGRITGKSKLSNWAQGINSIWYIVRERVRTKQKGFRTRCGLD